MNAPFEPFDHHEPAMLRVPPHSIESEQAVLGALLLDNSAWDRCADLLTEVDFYRHENRLVFSALASMINSNRSADVVTVFEYLQRQGKADDAGGLLYLNQLAQYLPSAASIRRYAEIVRERAILRLLVAASDEIATAAFNPQDRTVAEILDEAQQKVCAIGDQGSPSDEWEDLSEGMVRLLDRIQEHADGNAPKDYISTGLADLDERLDGGPRPGELIVLGARPRMGKSALMLTIADHVARAEGLPVALFTMEMPRAQVHSRLMSMRARIHLSRIKRPERLKDFDWPGITRAVEELRHVPLYINDQSALTINQLRAKVRALRRRRGRIGLIAVDYLGLMNGTDPKQPRTYQLEEITKGLKALGKEVGSPVLLLAQINRGVEQRNDQMPMLSDLRDSGAIEQDADVVAFLHREIIVKPDLADEWKYHAKLSVAKLRDGEPGLIDLMYIGEHTLFQSWPADMEVPTSKVRVGRPTTAKEL